MVPEKVKQKMSSKWRQLFSVIRKTPELIGPARPTARVMKQLSSLDDQQCLRFQIPMIFFYKNDPSPAMQGRDPVKVIREALSKALVFYYPLAGRLKEVSNRKLMVDCNGEGVLFVEAEANVKLEQLEIDDAIRPPCPYLHELLYNVPGSEGIFGCPLLLIQVTRLACGGFILALRLNHTMCDAFGLLQFMKAIEDMAKGANEPSLQPVWQRELLSPRNPPKITCTHHEYDDQTDSTLAMNPNDHIIDHKSFHFGPKEITALRNQLPQHLRDGCSTFELLTACIWRCRTIALQMNSDEIVRVTCCVNIRGTKYNMMLPNSYYGNAIATPTACSKAGDLSKYSLGYAVDLVKKMKATASEEYVRSLIDFLEIKERPMPAVKGTFVVSDITRSDFEELDLGWGKPVYAGPPEAVVFMSFYIKYRNKGSGEYGTLVPICLPLEAMQRFEEEIKKMTLR